MPNGTSLKNDLFKCVIDNSFEDIEKLLLQGSDPNQANRDGVTPLIIAALDGNVAIVKALLNKGAETDKAKQIAIKKEMDISIFSSWNLNRLPIHHENLIKCANKFGYSLNSEGICLGSTMRWIEATILGEQTRFIERKKKIKELNELLEPDGDEKLEDLQKKEGWKDILWDIKRKKRFHFFKGIGLVNMS